MSYGDDLSDTRPARPGGWTVARQRAFLADLAEHGRVADAARAVGLSVASAYRLRARETAFAFGWRAAQSLAYDRLRDLALDRALNGVSGPRIHRGAVVGQQVRYSDRLLLGLLNHLKPEGEIDFATKRRKPAVEPATLWGAAVDAYDTAFESGAPPATSRITDPAVREPPVPLTRAEVMAAIEALPTNARLAAAIIGKMMAGRATAVGPVTTHRGSPPTTSIRPTTAVNSTSPTMPPDGAGRGPRRRR